VSTWEAVAELPVAIDDYALEPRSAAVSSDFERKSTLIRLCGAGQEGVGEDVTYDGVDQDILQAAGPTLELAGHFTLASFSERLAELELFPQPPQREISSRYRTWAYESAALDLALRQARTTLHGALGREPQPVRFVVSLRLGEPPSLEPLRSRLELYPDLRFKLDPTSSWDETLIAGLLATGAVDSVDFKGLYHGSIADIEALPYPPRMVNIKPSRLGGLRSLLDTYDYCSERGIGNYGGGQFELGVGRGQNQYLASLFHADAPNDVAPTGFNLPSTPADLPSSPLQPPPGIVGFHWA
jgi:hypothetical protein